MKRNFSRAVILLIAVFICEFGNCADWRYAGFSQTELGDAHVFYDISSVTRSNSGSVRVWTRSFLTNDIEGTDPLSDAVIEEAMQKFRSGYCPKYVGLRPVAKKHKNENTAQACAELTTLEILANVQRLPTSSTIFWEVDCLQKRVRHLSISLSDHDGKLKKGVDHIGDWMHISPESNGEYLLLLTCEP